MDMNEVFENFEVGKEIEIPARLRYDEEGS